VILQSFDELTQHPKKLKKVSSKVSLESSLNEEKLTIKVGNCAFQINFE